MPNWRRASSLAVSSIGLRFFRLFCFVLPLICFRIEVCSSSSVVQYQYCVDIFPWAVACSCTSANDRCSVNETSMNGSS